MRGIGNSEKRRIIFDTYRFQTDAILLQETHSTPEVEKLWENEWGGKIWYSHGSSAARGVMIMLHPGFNPKILKTSKDNDGRRLRIDLEHEDEKYSVFNIYAPNTDSPEFFTRVEEELRESETNVIIMGDFNLVLDPIKDRHNSYVNNKRACQVVLSIMDEYMLYDAWRVRNENEIQYSWSKNFDEECKASRIDLALVSSTVMQGMHDTFFKAGIKTDHRALVIIVDIVQKDRGPGYWKLNSNHLNDPHFKEELGKAIAQDMLALQQKSDKNRWGFLKTRIKKKAISLSRKKGDDRSIAIAQLHENINEMESRLPLPRAQSEILSNSKKELYSLLQEKVQGIMFRSKAKWYSEGERSTKYFLNLEKNRASTKNCEQLFNDKGELLTETSQILEEQRQFYQNLYKLNTEVEFDLKNETGIVVEENLIVNEQLTMEEFDTALKELAKQKTPGPDGLTVEFYQIYWSQIRYVVYGAMMQTFNEGILYRSAREGILNLIPKQGKDTRMLKNLRPITLLNVDYKLLEKVIANRMLPMLETVINHDQRGFMPNWRISVNIRKMLDIIQHADKDNLNAVIISCDFQKAFDKIALESLLGALTYFKFPETIIKWTKIVYTQFEVRVQNRGFFSQKINIEQGLHQGGPCSSLYFLVIAEILAILLRNNKDLKGIPIAEVMNVLNQFADDLDVFSEGTESSISAAMNTFDLYYKQTGLQMNYDKTTLYRIGSLKHAKAKLYTNEDLNKIRYTNEDINVLGVCISHSEIMEKNYLPLLEKSKQVMNDWKNRGLSLLGKITIVNTLVASLYVYRMAVLPRIPSKIVKVFEDLVTKFVWNGGKPKIAKKILQAPKRLGGLKLINLEYRDIAIKCTWPQILENENNYAKTVYKTIIQTFEVNIWRATLHWNDVCQINIGNKFWNDVLWCWAKFNFSQNSEPQYQIIWFNSHIKIGKEILWWKDCYEAGLVYVYQLFEKGTVISAIKCAQMYKLDFVRLGGLISAIPREWKDYFLTHNEYELHPIIPCTYDRVIHKKYLASHIYNYLINCTTNIIFKKAAWERDLGLKMSDREFYQELNRIYVITNVTKLRSFQYKLLNRAILSNTKLYLWSVVDTPTCLQCNKSEETVMHMLILCEKVQPLWQWLQNHIARKFELTCVLTVENIIFNRIVEAKHVANFLCLITKYYIYQSKCANNNVNVYTLEKRIMEVENMEKYVAIKNGNLNKHVKKWGDK